METNRVKTLENELSQYLKKRKILSVILFVVFLMVGIVFSAIREATKEVTVYSLGCFSSKTVTYNEDYFIGILLGFMAATVVGCFLFVDFAFCRFRTVEVNGHWITVYRGMNRCSVYIDGEEKDRIGMFSLTGVMDTSLPDGTKISVAFSKSAFLMAHVSFSDKHSPIDL